MAERFVFTPEQQFESEQVHRRQVEYIYRHECLGETQTAIAKSWHLSTSRAFQIYHSGIKNQRRGLI